MRSYQDSLLRHHRELDQRLRTNRDRCFVSGWQVENRFASAYVEHADLLRSVGSNVGTYQFLSDQTDLTRAIMRFHDDRDGLALGEDSIFVAPGASPLIVAIMAAIANRGWRRVFYLPPLYYAFFYWSKVFGIELVPVTDRWVAMTNVEFSLPTERTVLMFSDPAWVLGRSLNCAVIDKIARWQAETGSLAVVDGTFQYTKWDLGKTGEYSSQLPPDQTLRLVSPTKAVGANGIRFAYVLTPDGFREDLRYTASNASGASDSFNVAAARIIMAALSGRNRNIAFIEQIRDRYERLRGRLFREPPVMPDCTYYTFAELVVDRDLCLVMDAPFFSGPDLPGVRVNLMLPTTELKKVAIEIADGYCASPLCVSSTHPTSYLS